MGACRLLSRWSPGQKLSLFALFLVGAYFSLTSRDDESFIQLQINHSSNDPSSQHQQTQTNHLLQHRQLQQHHYEKLQQQSRNVKVMSAVSAYHAYNKTRADKAAKKLKRYIEKISQVKSSYISGLIPEKAKTDLDKGIRWDNELLIFPYDPLKLEESVLPRRYNFSHFQAKDITVLRDAIGNSFDYSIFPKNVTKSFVPDKFLINNKDLCIDRSGEDIKVVIIVPSTWSNVADRQAIRNSWAKHVYEDAGIWGSGYVLGEFIVIATYLLDRSLMIGGKKNS